MKQRGAVISPRTALAARGGSRVQYEKGSGVSPPPTAMPQEGGRVMTTSATDAPLTVSTDGTAGPYVIVTPEQFGPVTEALRTEGLRFRVDEDAVLLSGMPALAVIDFGPGADVDRVQRVLDHIAADPQGRGRRRRRSQTRKEMVVRGDVEPMQELRRRLDEAAVGEWTRRPDVEERFRKTLPQRTSAHCFSKRVPAIGRQVAVLMEGRGRGNGEELYVSGVVPLEGREPLSLDQHDQVVADVRASLIEPLARDLGVRILDCRAHVGPALEDGLSPEALNRLRAFSAVADKGNLHPLDMQRWAGFIGQTHLDDAVIDLGLLAAWLEEDGFPPQQRELLVHEYESGRRLLSAYDEERR
jgi:hypothetical protein